MDNETMEMLASGRDEALEYTLRGAVIARLKKGGNEPVLVSEMAREHQMEEDVFEWHCHSLLDMKTVQRVREKGKKGAWMWKLSDWAWKAVQPKKKGADNG